MLKGFEVNVAGAGKGVLAGGGAIGISCGRCPGMTRVCDKAFCNSAWAFLALASRGFVGRIAGAFGGRSLACGRFGSGRRLNFGSKGLDNTLAMKTDARAVTITPSTRYVRRTRRHRRPRGS